MTFLAGNAGLNPAFDRKLLLRIEDAGLNASAPPQQLWMDGWLLRFSPGKAKRARCVNAVAHGRLSVAHKLARAQAVYEAAELPLVLRITPFTRPAALDAQLGALGFATTDDTRVLVLPSLLRRIASAPKGTGAAARRSAWAWRWASGEPRKPPTACANGSWLTR